MIRHLSLILILCICSRAPAQGKFDRRIIIEHDTFYAVEIDNETQLGKLYTGNINKPIESAIVYALPAGTKRRNQRFIPFAWTLYRDTLYCINFTEYAQNSHINSLKVIPVQALETYNAAEKPTKNLLQAAYANNPVVNFPLINTYKKYIYADDLYFDIAVIDGIITQFICIKNELTIWTYKNASWDQSETIPFQTNGFFSVFFSDGHFNILSVKGDYLIYPGRIYINPDTVAPTADKLIVEDRDHGSVRLLPAVWFDEASATVADIMKRVNN